MPAFQKGQSGNPKGRPKAHKNCQRLRDLIGAHAETIIEKLLLAAVNDGDVQAAKLLLERAIPPIKPVELPTPLPLPPDASLADQGRAVVLALASGKLPPTPAAMLLQGLGTLARLIELDELEKRTALVESAVVELKQLGVLKK